MTQWQFSILLTAFAAHHLWQRKQSKKIDRKLGMIVALVKVDQTVLDEIGNTLSGVADAVQEIVEDPSNDLGDAELSGITGPVTRLQDILTRPTEPVE